MERKIKICEVCKKIIYEEKERYTHIEDWAFAEKEGESWFHLECFKKSMNREQTILEKQAQGMLAQAKNIFNNLPPEMLQQKPKEFVI